MPVLRHRLGMTGWTESLLFSIEHKKTGLSVISETPCFQQFQRFLVFLRLHGRENRNTNAG